MAKKSVPEKSVAELMPDEINALRALVKEFMGKVSAIDNEVELLKEDRKELVEEYSEKLDMKTLQLALKMLKIQNSVAHQDAFDLFLEALGDPTA